MGWALQGYYTEYNGNRTWRIDSGNAKGLDPEIETFDFKVIKNVCDSVRVYYGTSGSRYFRGFFEDKRIDDDEAKHLLEPFEGLPVYAGKYGGRTTFSCHKMRFMTIGNHTVFFDKEKCSEFLMEDYPDLIKEKEL